MAQIPPGTKFFKRKANGRILAGVPATAPGVGYQFTFTDNNEPLNQSQVTPNKFNGTSYEAIMAERRTTSASGTALATLTGILSSHQSINFRASNLQHMVGESLLNSLVTTFDQVPDFTDLESRPEYELSNFNNYPDVKSYVLKPVQDIRSVIEAKAASDPSSDILEFDYLYNFLRSYIDMFHDFLSAGFSIKKYLEQKLMTYIQSTPKTQAQAVDAQKWMTIINAPNTGIFTLGDKVSQPRCKLILEDIVDDYINKLHDKYGIKFLPRRKQQAFKKTVTLPNPKSNIDDFEDLIDIMTKNNISNYFVESLSSRIGDFLNKANINNINFSIGDWDGGSGYAIGTKGIIGPTSPPPFTLPNPVVNVFGYMVAVKPQDATHAERLIIINEKKQGFYISPKMKLELNNIAQTLGLGRIRGSGESETSRMPVAIKNPSEIGESFPMETDKIEAAAMLMSLKTWTDLVQIRASTLLKKQNPAAKVAVVISDGLCETTARMNGLSYVLFNQGKSVSLYCYDLNALTLTIDEVKRKARVKEIIKQMTQPISQYIKQWFDVRINRLKEIIQVTPLPSLFFTASLFLDIYQNNYSKIGDVLQKTLMDSVENLPNTLQEYLEAVLQSSTTLASFLDQIEIFDNSFQPFLELRERTPGDAFMEAYYKVSNKIVDTFNKLTSKTQLDLYVAITICYFIFLKTDPSKYKTTIDTVKAHLTPSHADYSKIIQIENVFNMLLSGGPAYTSYIKSLIENQTKDTIVVAQPQFSFSSMLRMLESRLTPPAASGGLRKRFPKRRTSRMRNNRRASTRRRKTSRRK